MMLAQVTDTHIVRRGELTLGRIDAAAMLARCVARLNGLSPRPDAVVVTGDLTDLGRPEDYALVRELLAPLAMPVYVLPGNHDDRTALRAGFADHRYLPADGTFVHYVVDDLPVRLIALDTVIPGQAGGALCAARLGWLAERLAEAPDRPTIVAMHHPPFDTGIPFMDRIGLSGRDAFAELIAGHRQVERVICGHVHRTIHTRCGGTVASVCPSNAHHVVLTFDADQDDAWVYEPPGFQLHVWLPGQGLVTHGVPVDQAEPQSFGGADMDPASIDPPELFA